VILSVLLAGCAVGFLPHNFPQARMFMGDVGSVPLGFLLMFLSVWLARDGGGWLWLPLGALHAGFVLDTSITMIRRALRGEKVQEAHREHFYQRLVRAGWSHPAVTGVQMMLSVGLLAMWLTVVIVGRNLLVPAAMVTVTVWTVYFAFCERVFVRRIR
jgi:UDP-N-acetylmuramyl pentapeptide phosphotransferase/UDP-N-acetylglucosamine-1-phosphate transferase